MGLRSKPRVTVLADPDEDDFDGVELVTFDAPPAAAFDDEPLIDPNPPAQSTAAIGDQLDASTGAIATDQSAAADPAAAGGFASRSATVVVPPVPSARHDEGPEAENAAAVRVASRRTGRRGRLLALLGLMAAAALGGGYLAHDHEPRQVVATAPPTRPSARGRNGHHRRASRPPSRPKRAAPPRRVRRRHKRQHVPHTGVTSTPGPSASVAPGRVVAPAAPSPPSPLASVRPPVSAPAPRAASPRGGEFVIGGP